MRGGAVVRCDSCQQKYRIKSAHIERVVLTGPRTLDETDSVLRSDSVDIEPDEVSPVSIDDDGNVVGLSGLSELMRWSDAEGSQDKLKARVDSDAAAAQQPLIAMAAKEPAQAKLDESSLTRTRTRTRRKEKRKNLILLGGLLGAVVIAGIIIVIVVTSGQPPKAAGGTKDGDAAPNNGGTQTPNKNPGNSPKPNDNRPDPDKGTDPTIPEIFPQNDRPTPNDKPLFVAPWTDPDPDMVPVDVPTVLTIGKRVAYEGWYVMSPPRGFASSATEADLVLGELKPIPLVDGTTMLTGNVQNTSTKTVLNGELHVMILDSSGRVFAETYLPLVMMPPGSEQAVSLPIDSRYWDKSRGVRSDIRVTGWAEKITPMEGVNVDAAGQGEAAAVRVSVRHYDRKTLKQAMILIKALDAQGKSFARYLVSEEDLDVSRGDWLDLVISTPLLQGEKAVSWSAEVHPQ